MTSRSVVSRHGGIPTALRRPRLHHTTERGWINDPLGLTYHDGRYHLFTQHLPGTVEWNPGCHWAHATSTDLLHWSPAPIALSPGDGDDGVWSGCIVPSQGEPARLFYTSVELTDIQIGRIRVARPDDPDWTSWTKGPVVAELPPGIDATAYRDPWVMHDGERWRMLVGGGLADGTAVAWSYSSADLETWDFDGEAARRASSDTSPLWTGTVWECPQLFRLQERWVLTVSVWEPWTPHYVAYAVGDYADGRFSAQSWKRLSYGPSYYAPSSFTDRDGNRGLVYWLREFSDPDSGWAGATSVPHLLHIDGQTLMARPHPNLDALRGPARRAKPGAPPLAVEPQLDVVWHLSALGDAASRLELATASPDGPTLLTIRQAGPTVLEVATGTGSWELPHTGGSVRVLADGPICEIFTADGVMAVPLEPAENMHLRTTGVVGATVYELAAATPPWTNPLAGER